MENRGWIKAQWALTENGRRAKYYKLTATGRRQLAAESKSWDEVSGAIAKIMAARRRPQVHHAPPPGPPPARRGVEVGGGVGRRDPKDRGRGARPPLPFACH